jgi:hypothetical protein
MCVYGAVEEETGYGNGTVELAKVEMSIFV